MVAYAIRATNSKSEVNFDQYDQKIKISISSMSAATLLGPGLVLTAAKPAGLCFAKALLVVGHLVSVCVSGCVSGCVCSSACVRYCGCVSG